MSKSERLVKNKISPKKVPFTVPRLSLMRLPFLSLYNRIHYFASPKPDVSLCCPRLQVLLQDFLERTGKKGNKRKRTTITVRSLSQKECRGPESSFSGEERRVTRVVWFIVYRK